MKLKIGGLIILFLIIGYILGQFIPTEFLRPTIETKSIETKDYYSLIVQIIGAIATFLAVAIALFREEIRKWWEYVEIEYTIPEEKFIEIFNPNIGNPSDGLSQPLEAEKYQCSIQLHNKGTISSHSSEIILESIIFECKDYNSPQPLEISGKPLYWGNSKETQIIIPPKGKKKIAILELIPPDKESSPGGDETTTAPQLLISGVETNILHSNGTWKAIYLIYSSNSKPKRFKVEITWNGKWQGRFTEMKECLTIILK